MNRTALTAVLIVLGIAAVVAYLTLFTVYQTQQALVLEGGQDPPGGRAVEAHGLGEGGHRCVGPGGGGDGA